MWKDMAGSAADVNDENGGCVPDENGMMRGLPGSGEETLERMAAEPGPRGPIPLLPSPAEARQARRAGGGGPSGGASGGGASPNGGGPSGSGGATGAVDPDDVMFGVPPGKKLIGKPGPYDRRYYMGHDFMGSKIVGLDPLREKPRPERPSSS
jgi:hypothetical protein